MVSIDDVNYFRADHKYVCVGSVRGELYIRTPLKALITRLDPDVFWQIHRGTVVRVSEIDRICRDDDHGLKVVLSGSANTFSVSSTFQHRFRGM